MTTDTTLRTIEGLLDMIAQHEKETEKARAEQAAFMKECEANPDKVIAWLERGDPEETLGEALSRDGD